MERRLLAAHSYRVGWRPRKPVEVMSSSDSCGRLGVPLGG
jgi:hypothetical protein